MRRDAEARGHIAGVLRPGPAEGKQGVGRGIVALEHRDFPDGIGHVLHCEIEQDPQELIAREVAGGASD